MVAQASRRRAPAGMPHGAAEASAYRVERGHGRPSERAGAAIEQRPSHERCGRPTTLRAGLGSGPDQIMGLKPNTLPEHPVRAVLTVAVCFMLRRPHQAVKLEVA